MREAALRTVAVIGTGVIGRSWARLFAHNGCETRLFDRDATQIQTAMDWIEADLAGRQSTGDISVDDAKATQSRLVICPTLEDALSGVEYVQENGPERLDIKQALFSELDRVAPPAAILASSTSALDMTTIATAVPGAERCIVAHPVNPPHVVPLVEVLPGERTIESVTERTCRFLRSVGQTPVRLSSYVPGFVLNRLQAAVLREAIDLVKRGIADPAAVDAVMRDGLGLRWAVLGPFGTGDTNADGGIREYLTRYRDAYLTLMSDLADTSPIDDALVDQLGRDTDALQGGADRSEIRAWRDRLVERIRRIKDEDPHPGSAGG